MRRFASLPAVAVLALLVGRVSGDEPAAPPADMQVFLLAGQSNMVGRGRIVPEDRWTHPRIFMLTKDLSWVPARHPVHFSGGVTPTIGLGLCMDFAKVLVDRDPNLTIGFVPCAVGGTGLDQWLPSKDPNSLYGQAVTRTREALKRGRLAGMLWHQGEADCNHPPNVHTYVARFARMVASLRRDLDAPHMPVIVGELGSDATVFHELAIRRIPAAVPDSWWVSTEGIRSGLHFENPDYRELGRRYAAAYLTFADRSPPRAAATAWASPPAAVAATAVAMTAAAATDENGVEYLFANESFADGSHDSGWQTSREYLHVGLEPGRAYRYRVRLRDRTPSHNEAPPSPPVEVTTPGRDPAAGMVGGRRLVPELRLAAGGPPDFAFFAGEAAEVLVGAGGLEATGLTPPAPDPQALGGARALVLLDSQTWRSDAAWPLRFAAAVSTLRTGSTTLTVEGTGAIALPPLQGRGTVVKRGSGTLVLARSGIGFGGEVVVEQGTLVVPGGDGSTLGIDAATYRLAGGTLAFEGSGPRFFMQPTEIRSNARIAFTRGAPGPEPVAVFDRLVLGTGPLVVETRDGAGPDVVAEWSDTALTDDATLDVGGSCRVELGNVVELEGSHGLTKRGRGALVTGSNTFTGPVRVEAGSFTFATLPRADRSVTVSPGAELVCTATAGNAVLRALAETEAAFVLALAAPSGESIDLAGDAGGRFPGLSLGARGPQEVRYSGTIAPHGETYRLGGGGHLGATGRLTDGRRLVVRGPGRVTLHHAANEHGETVVERGAWLGFDAPGAIGGSGRSVRAEPGARLELQWPLGNAFLCRLVETDAPFVISSSSREPDEDLDFSGGEGARLPGATLGAGSNGRAYAGRLTPCDATYRLGGGEGVLALPRPGTLAGQASLAVAHGPVAIQAGNDFSGPTTIRGTRLVLEKDGAIGRSAGIVLESGGGLEIVAAPQAAATDRIGDAAGVTVRGGGRLTVSHEKDAADLAKAADLAEAVGPLVVERGQFTISAAKPAPDRRCDLAFAGQPRVSPHGTVLLAMNQASYGTAAAGAVRVLFTGQGDLGGGTGDWLGPGYSIAGRAFAGYGEHGVVALVPRPLKPGDTPDAIVGGNARLDGGTHRWRALDCGTVDLGGGTAVIVGGAICHSYATGLLANGTVTAGAGTSAPLFVHVDQSRLAISASIVDHPGGGRVAVVKGGEAGGVLVLAGANRHGGGAIVNAGILALADDRALGEGGLEVAAGARVELEPGVRAACRKLIVDGVGREPGTWGSSASTAEHVDDVHFFGGGVLAVRERP